VDAATSSRLVAWSRTRTAGRATQLRVTDRTIGACALGFRRPVILVSRQLLDTLDVQALDQVVMHEQAHLDRFDDWLRLGQAVITAAAGIHPAIHFVGRRIDLEREAACDDRVVAQTGAARRYAACLATVGAVSLGQPVSGQPTLLPGMARSRGTLVQRVARLLDPRRGHGLRLDPAAAVVTMAALLLAVASSRHAGPMVEVVDTEESVVLATPAAARPVLPVYSAGVPAVGAPAIAAPARLMAREDGPRGPAPAAPAAGQPRLAAPSRPASTTSPSPAALETTGVHTAVEPGGPPSIASAAPPALTAPAADDDSPWAALAATGSSIGAGSKKAGVAVAGFFSRAAKATASSF
jgi:hypothetical protein